MARAPALINHLQIAPQQTTNFWPENSAGRAVRRAGYTERADLQQGSLGDVASVAVEDRIVASAGTAGVNGTFSGTFRPMRLFPIPRSALFAFAAVGLVTVFALGGCGNDDKNPVTPGGGGPSSTQLTGTFINGNEGGLMNLIIASATLAPALRAASIGAHDIVANATLSPDVGGTINLTGTYNEEADSLNLTGGGYAMSGKFNPTGGVGGIVGRYTGPKGSGFFGCAVGGSNGVQVYCGSFENQIQTVSGRWNILVIGDEVVGVAAASGDEPFGFIGTASGTGTTRTIAIFTDRGDGTVVTANGTLDTTTDDVGGTWTIQENSVVTDFGTWSGTLCQPGGTGPD